MADDEQARVEALIDKWGKLAGGAERANFAPFIYALADALGLPTPEPAEGGKLGAYQFEAPIPKGSSRNPLHKGSADLYKRGHFVMEAKQTYMPPKDDRSAELFDEGATVVPLTPAGSRYDRFMATARAQVENYAKNLPEDEPVAPFLIVCDIGRAFEIYFDFAGNGRGYGFFPDKTSYRIPLPRLREPEVRELLRDIWTNPSARDPRLKSAEVTREVAARLAKVSEWLEHTQKQKTKGLSPQEQSIAVEDTALFVMRLLFCMFAEDIGLLPEKSFTRFLEEALTDERYFEAGLHDLWSKMNSAHGGRYSTAIREDVRYFNGGLFESDKVYVLGREERGELLAAARKEWRNVEPAIFGTLLEQALNEKERSRLGAHYTPRAYVERLVDATIMEVLRAEWDDVQSVLTQPTVTPSDALRSARAFHDRLARVTVLDPACGTGNFLYVAMEAIERLESEVIEAIESLGGEARSRISPAQFHGLELNERAARIAELVLWIGWLRFRIKTDPDSIEDPVLARGAHINFGRHGGYDAVLKRGATADYDFENPSLPDWPEAEFIVGNPPFIGKGSAMRSALGDDYVQALRQANSRVPRSADFVMQWWDRAAHILTAPASPLRRFGLVTTNSISQSFNRRVIEAYLHKGEDEETDEGRLSLIYAIPDHPWTKVGQGAAAVRIAMTVGEAGEQPGRLLEVISERATDSDAPRVEARETIGRINADLSVGADVTSLRPLRANAGLSCNGMMLAGQGFKITQAVADRLIAMGGAKAQSVIRPYLGGAELLQGSRGTLVIDLYGLGEKQVRKELPAIYDYLLQNVWPERKSNRRPAFRTRWWVFGEPRSTFRPALAGLRRYIATTETSAHRVFQFLPTETLLDHSSIAIGSADAFHLGVLSSRIHVEWALATGAWLGVGNDSRYSKSKVFDPFPFPDATPEVRARITAIGEELDETRKAALAETPGLTMTELYNLKQKVSSGGVMTANEDDRATRARARIVARLHDQLDAAVAEAYGWPVDLPPAEIVARLVALNAERKAEEEAGTVRWLRPEYQEPRFA